MKEPTDKKAPQEGEIRPRGRSRRLPFPWPFRESVVPGRGLVRNVPAQPDNKPPPDGPSNVRKGGA